MMSLQSPECDFDIHPVLGTPDPDHEDGLRLSAMSPGPTQLPHTEPCWKSRSTGLENLLLSLEYDLATGKIASTYQQLTAKQSSLNLQRPSDQTHTQEIARRDSVLQLQPL